jgi:glutathione S-transferase
MSDGNGAGRKPGMFHYSTLDEVKRRPGLRLVLVKGVPSPWAQAAKTIFEIKGVEYVAAPWIPFDDNADIVNWSGITTAPIVVWNDEKAIHGWREILELSERLSPQLSLIPRNPDDRASMFSLSSEICGPLGLGWNRRLQIVAPAYSAPDRPNALTRFGDKHGYNEGDAKSAAERIVATLRKLSQRLSAQTERGSKYMIGNSLSALDVYWTAFANMLVPLPSDLLPMPEELRQMYLCRDPVVMGALDDNLVAHRDFVFLRHFRCPMEL